jgi:hypothetical protein
VARPGIGAGVVYPLIPYGVTPAATADAADVAAGRTWLNYGLLAGHCLYEKSITSGAPAFVYIAPDNSTWRVVYTHYSMLGVPGLRLQFYPLRKLFLQIDTWGGLAQTIDVPCSPTPPSYTVGDLYDLDSKVRQCHFLQTEYGSDDSTRSRLAEYPRHSSCIDSDLYAGDRQPRCQRALFANRQLSAA